MLSCNMPRPNPNQYQTPPEPSSRAKAEDRGTSPGTDIGLHESQYTEERGKMFCVLVSEGRTIDQAATRMGMTAATVWRWLRDYHDFEAMYDRAREARGEYYGLKVGLLAEDCQNGQVTPDRAKVAMAGYQWSASRMAPRRWAERKTVEHKGEVQHIAKWDLSKMAPSDYLLMVKKMEGREGAALPPPGEIVSTQDTTTD